MSLFSLRYLPATAPSSIAASVVTLMAACGTQTPVTTSPSPAQLASAAQPSPPITSPRLNLAAEQLRLAELFRGTPVVFAMQQDGSLRATVPFRFSFEAGSVKIKPPLVAVLDRLAKSQASTNSRLRVSAPVDPGARAAPTLALDRAASVRDHLTAQGIAAARVQLGSKGPADLVEIIVSDTAR